MGWALGPAPGGQCREGPACGGAGRGRGASVRPTARVWVWAPRTGGWGTGTPFPGGGRGPRLRSELVNDDHCPALGHFRAAGGGPASGHCADPSASPRTGWWAATGRNCDLQEASGVEKRELFPRGCLCVLWPWHQRATPKRPGGWVSRCHPEVVAGLVASRPDRHPASRSAPMGSLFSSRTWAHGLEVNSALRANGQRGFVWIGRKLFFILFARVG